jgi:uncharacterized protein
MIPPLEKLIARLERLADRVEARLPPAPAEIDWSAQAFHWRRRQGMGVLQAVRHLHVIRFEDLHDIDDQKSRMEANTRHFVKGLPANNVLLTGARGTGKSSLVKAALHRFARQGLRLIEVDRADLVDLPEIVDLVAARPEKFIIFSDDLSFEASDPGYKALKSVLDGGVAALTDNVLIYATSNRRHLMPERMAENLAATHTGEGEIHPEETTEEKVSLSERFGLWISFYPFDQDHYLRIAAHWAGVLSGREVGEDEIRQPALLWALERGARSGRIAWHFARHWAAEHAGKRK